MAHRVGVPCSANPYKASRKTEYRHPCRNRRPNRAGQRRPPFG